jgi:hypothetical protein
MKDGSHFVVRKRAMQLTAGVVICLAFVWQMVIPFLHASEPTHIAISHSHGVSFFDHHSSTVPLFPCPNPPEAPASDEVEANDESNDELSSLFANLRGEDNDTLFAKKQLLSHLRVSLENRSSVSFVVLYHCWKSLLG